LYSKWYPILFIGNTGPVYQCCETGAMDEYYS